MAPAAPASLLNSESYFQLRALPRNLARLRTKCYRLRCLRACITSYGDGGLLRPLEASRRVRAVRHPRNAVADKTYGERGRGPRRRRETRGPGSESATKGDLSSQRPSRSAAKM